jgi:hypothetical protein
MGSLGVRRRRRVAEDIAATPHRFDIVIAAGRLSELFAQIADEHVNNLEFRLVCRPVKVIEKHCLREDGALVKAEELEDGIFLAGQGHRLVVYSANPGVEVDDQLACPDRRFSIALGTVEDRLNANCMICFELRQAAALSNNTLCKGSTS